MEITSIEQAINIIETQVFDIPVAAIKYLQKQEKNEYIDEKIRFHITTETEGDYDYYHDIGENYFINTPLWFAIVAESFVDENLLDFVHNTLLKNFDNDFLYEQLVRLQNIGIINGFTQKIVDQKIASIEKYCKEDASNINHYALCEFLEYAEKEEDKTKLLELFKIMCAEKLHHFGQLLPFTFAKLQYNEALPYLKAELKNAKNRPTKKQLLENPLLFLVDSSAMWYNEIESTIKMMENPEELEKSLNLKEERRTNIRDWEEVIPSDRFTKEAYLEILAEDRAQKASLMSSYSPETFKRSSEKLGKNDPCPCDSGKKYKKCCLGLGVYE